MRPLAVTSRYRLSQLPDVSALAETTLPGFHVTSWNELFAPRGLPDDVRKRLSDALVDAMRNDPPIRDKMTTLGVEPIGEPSERAEAFFDDELRQTAGIKLEP